VRAWRRQFRICSQNQEVSRRSGEEELQEVRAVQL
jgi:hypothetical protein